MRLTLLYEKTLNNIEIHSQQQKSINFAMLWHSKNVRRVVYPNNIEQRSFFASRHVQRTRPSLQPTLPRWNDSWPYRLDSGPGDITPLNRKTEPPPRWPSGMRSGHVAHVRRPICAQINQPTFIGEGRLLSQCSEWYHERHRQAGSLTTALLALTTHECGMSEPRSRFGLVGRVQVQLTARHTRSQLRSPLDSASATHKSRVRWPPVRTQANHSQVRAPVFVSPPYLLRLQVQSPLTLLARFAGATAVRPTVPLVFAVVIQSQEHLAVIVLMERLLLA